MKILELESDYEILKSRHPQWHKVFYPRRISCPAGYIDPKYYSLSMEGAYLTALTVGIKSTVDATIGHVVKSLIKYESPTYFVDPQFAVAAAATELPNDMKFGELRLPMPALLLVMPIGFVFDQIKWRIPYIAVAHKEAEVIQNSDGKPVSTVEMLLFHMPFYPEKGTTINYTGWFPANTTMGEVLHDVEFTNFEDTTVSEKETIKRLFNVEDIQLDFPSCIPNAQDEPKLINTLCLTGCKILAILNTLSNLVTVGVKTRAERVNSKNPKKNREALWSPNFIGKDFKVEREYTSQGGTHASPRMHWRRGHLHTVLFGEQRTQRRRQWYKPVLVNAPE